jgi:hypothetical protein
MSLQHPSLIGVPPSRRSTFFRMLLSFLTAFLFPAKKRPRIVTQQSAGADLSLLVLRQRIGSTTPALRP